ncbi:Spore coat protein CotF [Mesobacillus persicus]|uniref:Spore coat protein CotF n=1 Tax=Mesobacillus persicus TaxID=930146 RepID=A0A1H8I7X7_9BACI|nr:spore coat protein [Mesobacillus persicus]SEN64362.1 Spore coat protein CotF [Mesobacillus persicus]
MPFGAHETMEVHEILAEKINMISHFNIYAMQTKNPELKDMIMRHQQEEMKTYDAIVAYTHDYNQFSPIPPNTSVMNVKPDQIQYGLNNPSMLAPETNAVMNDYEVASAMLIAHKNAATNGVKATLEIADPNLRQMLMNGAVNCMNQAYEVFLFMNQQGLYQIPQIKDHTAKTYLHSYQPVGESLKAHFPVQPGQNLGQDNPMMAYMNQANAHSGQTHQQYTGGQGQMGAPVQRTMPMGGMAGRGSIGQQSNMGQTGQAMRPMGQMGNGNMNGGYQANMQSYRGNQQQYNH